MAHHPLPSFCIRFHLVIFTTLILTSTTVVHCRGLSDLDDSCGGCLRAIGKTVWQIVAGETDIESVTDDALESSPSHSDGLLALLMGVEGRQSRKDMECSACWIIVHRLKKRLGFSKALGDGYENFRKRAMLNNGWV